MRDPTETLSKDVAKKIAEYLKNRKDFFAFSSVNKKLRKFFESDRENLVKIPKIRVKKNEPSAFLLTFDGRLYASGTLISVMHKENLKKWTAIGPPGQKISDFVFAENFNILCVRCDKEWYQLGLTFSEWTPIIGPGEEIILELILTGPEVFARCENDLWYSSAWDPGARFAWKIVGPTQKKISALIACKEKVFVQCEDGWYGWVNNEFPGLALGEGSPSKKWVKLGPPGKSALRLMANDLNTIIYCSDGYWYGCGRNDSGQLGTGDILSRSYWTILGPKGKLIHSVFLEHEKIFVHCYDGLYASGDNSMGNFGTDDYRECKNWTHVGFANQDIIEIKTTSNATFIRCSDGWYATGDAEEGIFGSGDERQHGTWEKFHCQNQVILHLVSSKEFTFACCQDAWYFTGSNSSGVNGMNDKIRSRTRWIKGIPHGEEIEAVLAQVKINKLYRKSEPKSVQLRRMLKKFYELDTISWLEDSTAEIANSTISICYHEDYPEKHSLYFSLDSDGWNWIDGRQEDVFYRRISEILDSYPFEVLHEPRHYAPYYTIGWGHQCAPPSLSVPVTRENYEAICQFIKTYEAILDDQELKESESTLQLKK